jgi:hypothetical protein
MDPTDAQTQFENLYALVQAGDDEFDQKFLERIAVSAYPESLRLCEQYCYEKFDRFAEFAFPLLAVLPVSEFIEEYGQDLIIVQEGLLKSLRRQLGEPLSAEGKEIYRRAAANLGAKSLGWLARAKRAGATRPRPKSVARIAKPERLPARASCPNAVAKVDAYLKSKGIGLTEFAIQAGTTDRTLRRFRATGKVRRDILDGIAAAIGLSRETLLKP